MINLNRNYSEKVKYFFITLVSLLIVFLFLISYQNESSVKNSKSITSVAVRERFCNYLTAIEAEYKSCPYHNSTHGE